MTEEVLKYCEDNKIKCVFFDFFGTIVKRNCAPEEIKIFWAKTLALKLKYNISEEYLLTLRKKSEQAVILRAENREFNYEELMDEIYRRIISLDYNFKFKYSKMEFYKLSHEVEVQCELISQDYIEEDVELINKLYAKGVHINILSDFYMGRKEIEIFLKKNDLIKKIENIFVSSDCRTSKYLGGLYKYACKELEIDVTECIMIGDNQKSDVQNAELCGIKGFKVIHSEGEGQKKKVQLAITTISQSNISGVLGYSNYCFLLYLYVERLYKILIREGIKDIYFLSREGEFLKKIFDLYIDRRKKEEIHTHYLYVSRKATYPAGLKSLEEEKFDLLRKFSQLSILDFLENIGMREVVSELKLDISEAEKPIDNFFYSSEFNELCARKDFQKLYEHSRIQYNDFFKKYCEQEGVNSNNIIAIADVGWNGTMQDNISKALEGLECFGVYIGLINSAFISERNRKEGLIFKESPVDSKNLKLWEYDHVFLERVLCASHGATDCYKEQEKGIICPVLKEYSSEKENYELIKPIQKEIMIKIKKLDDVMLNSCYCAENFYEDFLDKHLHMLFVINNKQIELQKNMIESQMQNFGHFTTAGKSIEETFSRANIIKKAWRNLHILKNTETMFRILLNYNQKIAIKIIYYLHYIMLKRRRK